MQLYGYSEWVEICVSEFWHLLNQEFTNWFADYDDANRATERNRMILLWPILAFFKEKDKTKLMSIKDFFRVLRIFYLRYNNFDRSVTSISKDVKNFTINGPWNAPVNPEEHLKHNLLNNVKQSEIEKYEELIWKIEDHKFNLDGSDVGSVNIGYLFDLNEINSLGKLHRIKDKLYEVFPIEQDEYISIQNILLYYGEYWHRESPWYYFNYQFDDWRRIIRDRDHENKHTRTVFKTFFHEFIDFNGTIDDFLNKKRKIMLRHDK